MPDPDRLGRVLKAEVVDAGLVVTVEFVSLEAKQRAERIIANLDKYLFNVEDDRIFIDLATKDFYDGP